MKFQKYQGTGNDFVIVNGDLEDIDPTNHKQIRLICDRRFGIGADGFILIFSHDVYDFEMVYFNADGHRGSLCGNGSRCAVAFAREEEFFQTNTCIFLAYDGPHQAVIREDTTDVELKMMDVSNVESGKGMAVLDTGSPHYVTMVEDLSDLDIVEAGKHIRYSPRFAKEGINVNFVEPLDQGRLEVATYERGVEDETYSCGTGVTACALGYHILDPVHREGKQEVIVQTKGGNLSVRFNANNGIYTNVWLIGPVRKVFIGEMELDQ